MKKILIADDSLINREVLKNIFLEQFEIIEAENGVEAIESLDRLDNEISIVLLDLMMPKKNGIDVLMHMNFHKQIERIPVIMITGESTTDTDVKAYELGVSDIIYKPFSRRVVSRRVLNIIELYEHRIDVENQLKIRNKELSEAHKKMAKNNEFLINALSSVVEFRSLESGLHIQRVKELTRIMLNTWAVLYPEYGFSKEDIEQMSNAAALHDIGKIGVADEILLKPGKLNESEFELMKTHTTLGCELLEKFKQEESDFYKYCYDICRYHHERYDGAGYPDGLVGDDIPVWAQVVSIIDVYDALISPRVYKAPYDIKEAFRMITSGECGVFSDKILECFETAKYEIIKLTEG